jgi:hypothetical protein
MPTTPSEAVDLKLEVVVFGVSDLDRPFRVSFS